MKKPTAAEYAACYHKGQKRKYTGEDYVQHPIRVRRLLRNQYAVTEDQEILDAALLHDTVEDTAATFEEIRKLFGNRVCELVFWLTDTPDSGNRAMRKTLQVWKLSHAPAEAQLIKCADIMDNASNIQEHDPEFWKVYQNELVILMDHFCQDVKDTKLWQDTWQLLDGDKITGKVVYFERYKA